MRLPAQPALQSLQRFVGRFWDTSVLLEVLAVYHGATSAQYPRTWRYRTLIAVHRSVYNLLAYRKGYGPDWKSDIKNDLTAFLEKGTLPAAALPLAVEHVRQAELLAWAQQRAERLYAQIRKAA